VGGVKEIIAIKPCGSRGHLEMHRDMLSQRRNFDKVFWTGDTVSFVQEIHSKSPESHEKTSVSCHCKRIEAISWPIGGLLRRLRRLARMGKGRGVQIS
jgi:hypothetical protein